MPSSPRIAGVYHRVQKGQTLWRISQSYNVSIDEIIKINKLSDASKINKGQLLFIPRAKQVLIIETPAGKENFVWPLKGRILSFYGTKNGNISQRGINIQGKEGEKIIAARSGKVSFCSDYVKGYGKLIIIDHSDGFQTIYAHNYKNLIKQKQKVKQGTIIAKVGSTGRVFTPQLHFEIRKNFRPQNPLYYLP